MLRRARENQVFLTLHVLTLMLVNSFDSKDCGVKNPRLYVLDFICLTSLITGNKYLLSIYLLLSLNFLLLSFFCNLRNKRKPELIILRCHVMNSQIKNDETTKEGQVKV